MQDNQIEINTTILVEVEMEFKTRDGHIVRIIDIEPDFTFPIAAMIVSTPMGEVLLNHVFVSYTHDGRVRRDVKHDLDLVAYLP
jgi:ribulose bisphosphate carboxylase small subunit